MSTQMIGLDASGGLGMSVDKAIPMIANLGFDATFTAFGTPTEINRLANLIAKHGLVYSSIHAPFKKNRELWFDTLDGEDAMRDQTDCIDACAAFNVPISVVHPWIGFADHESEPTAIGLERFRRLADHAEKKGVRIALENLEGENKLRRLMKELWDHPAVGFCLDTGHELCYNHGRDLLAEFGERLIYTHINSNMGITSPDGSIFWHDDSHMLPFDGIVDMENVAARFKKYGYNGVLMLELVRGNKGDKHTNDRYLAMTDEEYLTEAYKRICRLRDLISH